MTLTPTRSVRFLSGAATILLAAVLAFGLFGLTGAAFGFGVNGKDVDVHAQVPVNRASFAPEVDAKAYVDATIQIRDATPSQFRWAFGRDLSWVVVAVVCLWLLRGLLRSVRDGDPFTEANVKRLRTLAVVVLIGVPFATYFASVLDGELANSVSLGSRGAAVDIAPGSVLLGALALFVLAEVFAAGVRIRDDLEGTV